MQKLRTFFKSRIFLCIVFALGVITVLTCNEVIGVAVFINLMGIMLLVCPETPVTFAPFLIMCAFVTKCYDSFYVFKPLWYLAIFPACALVAHFVIYRKKLSTGRSIKGIIAVTVAVTLGGIGSISFFEYFSWASVYYIIGLGIGMAVVYLILRAVFVEYDRYSSEKAFTEGMYLLGIFASFMVFSHYFMVYDSSVPIEVTLYFQWSNNISTMLMFAMPIPLYYCRKHPIHIISSCVMYAAACLSTSRGGMLMGGIELLICLFAFAMMDPGKRKYRLPLLVIILSAGFTAVMLLLPVNEYISGFILKDETRVKLIYRSFEDFLSNPVFGIGIGNRANADLYNGKVGTMVWYHMMIPQIIGSMGTIGIAAYGYQLVQRVRLVIKNFDHFTLTLGLSYVGLLLMSQVNPGEFCPVPYTLLAVLIFILIEKHEKIKG